MFKVITSKFQFLILCIFLNTISINAQHSIIPIPVSYTSVNESFVFSNELFLETTIEDGKIRAHIDQFRDFLANYKITLVNRKAKSNVLNISLNSSTNSTIGDEGYLLVIKDQNIKLSANKPAGIFNGIQTLKQLFPIHNDVGTKLTIKACNIMDYPRFKWRGLMLDVSRHFFTVDEVKDYINQMSAYKFNVLHWHLTDDQGWRIEIKSLPKLTDIGAWRVERPIFGGKAPLPGEKATDGGFYTQEEVKNIINYAADRNITIVPEIDVPGHSMAALAAYPEFSVKKEPKYVSPGNRFSEWYGDGNFKMLIENTLNPADEKVYDFVDKIFTEIAELFPGEYIHMGGDEAYHGYWEENQEVQEFMKLHRINDSHELQSYFVQRVEKIINSKGKKMIGWDEILEGGLADNAAVMSWRGMKGGIAAAKMKHKVVMSPTTFAYLDYMQGDESLENKIYSSLSLEKAYQFEPVPNGVDPKYILGGQGNLWTEAIPTMSFAFYMTYPRAFAIAESTWSPSENKNWASFMKRTEVHFDRFDANNTNICKAVYDPIVLVDKIDDKLMCELKNSIPNSEIYYTIDNSYPVKYGVKYTDAFEIPEGKIKLRAQTFVDGKAIGRALTIDRKILKKRVGKKPFSF